MCSVEIFDKFEGRSSERTWVYKVATNAMLMLYRKAGNRTTGAERTATVTFSQLGLTVRSYACCCPQSCHGSFTVSVSESIVQLSLLDIRGRLIRSWTNPGEECVVDARSLTAGIYFVVATTATGISSQRVVVE